MTRSSIPILAATLVAAALAGCLDVGEEARENSTGDGTGDIAPSGGCVDVGGNDSNETAGEECEEDPDTIGA